MYAKIRSTLSVQKYQFYDDFYRYLYIQIPFSRMRVEGKRLNDTLRPTPIFVLLKLHYSKWNHRKKSVKSFGVDCENFHCIATWCWNWWKLGHKKLPFDKIGVGKIQLFHVTMSVVTNRHFYGAKIRNRKLVWIFAHNLACSLLHVPEL